MTRAHHKSEGLEWGITIHTHSGEYAANYSSAVMIGAVRALMTFFYCSIPVLIFTQIINLSMFHLLSVKNTGTRQYHCSVMTSDGYVFKFCPVQLVIVY